MTSIITRTAIAGIAAAALAAPGFAASAFAFDFDYDRAAAETPGGAADIHAALQTEVTEHCTVSEWPTALLNDASTKRCVAETMDKAVKQIGTAAMDAVHAAAAG
ncbi:MAG: UrcA family protein [Pseudomonadota bacterium]